MTALKWLEVKLLANTELSWSNQGPLCKPKRDRVIWKWTGKFRAELRFGSYLSSAPYANLAEPLNPSVSNVASYHLKKARDRCLKVHGHSLLASAPIKLREHWHKHWKVGRLRGLPAYLSNSAEHVHDSAHKVDERQHTQQQLPLKMCNFNMTAHGPYHYRHEGGCRW